MRAVFEEFENYIVPPWTKIKNDIQQSSAAFVLLSPHLNSTPYTQNWVSYEVGLACALNKPVWVYEQLEDSVLFPIPYLTDYVVYSPQNRQHLNAIKGLLETYDPSPSLIGLGLGAIIGGALSGGPGAGVGAMLGAAALQRSSGGHPITCPHQTCGIKYKIYSQFQQISCPSCRQTIQINWSMPMSGGPDEGW
jgi:hypothetical protein